MIRIGFGTHYTITLIRNPKNSIGSHLSPYFTAASVSSFTDRVKGMHHRIRVWLSLRVQVLLTSGR